MRRGKRNRRPVPALEREEVLLFSRRLSSTRVTFVFLGRPDGTSCDLSTRFHTRSASRGVLFRWDRRGGRGSFYRWQNEWRFVRRATHSAPCCQASFGSASRSRPYESL